MNTRSALWAAIACGAAAVLIVGIDLALNVDAWLEVKGADGTWTTVSQSDPSSRPYVQSPVCGNDFRLSVRNGLLWSVKEAITVQSSGPAPAHPITQTWVLSARETRAFEFHLNGTVPAANPNGVPFKGVDSVQVQVGPSISLYAPVCPEASK